MHFIALEYDSHSQEEKGKENAASSFMFLTGKGDYC